MAREMAREMEMARKMGRDMEKAREMGERGGETGRRR
jgi:hypothetical protein